MEGRRGCLAAQGVSLRPPPREKGTQRSDAPCVVVEFPPPKGDANGEPKITFEA